MQSFEEGLVCNLEVLVGTVEWDSFHLLLCIYKRDEAASRAQNEFRLVLEENLNHFVGVSQEDRFLSSLPFLDVA